MPNASGMESAISAIFGAGGGVATTRSDSGSPKLFNFISTKSLCSKDRPSSVNSLKDKTSL